MDLPQVTSASDFERHNALLCTVTFEAPVSRQQQVKLNDIALNSSQAGNREPGYFLQFGPDGKTLLIYQKGGDFRRVPTREEFGQLLTKLDIELPPPKTAFQHHSAPQPGHETQRAAA